MSDLADQLSRHWSDLGSVLRNRRLLESLHTGHGVTLTPSNLRALSVLGDGEGLRVGELAERVGIDETTATRLADRLASAGLLERRGDPDDRRVTVVVLTTSGRRLARAIAQQRRRFFSDVLAALEPEERAELVRLTEKAAGALQVTSEELIAR